jgi:hypothetical protein
VRDTWFVAVVVVIAGLMVFGFRVPDYLEEHDPPPPDPVPGCTWSAAPSLTWRSALVHVRPPSRLKASGVLMKANGDIGGPVYRLIGREVVRLLRLRPLVPSGSLDPAIRPFAALLCSPDRSTIARIPELPIEDIYPLSRLPDTIQAGCGALLLSDSRTVVAGVAFDTSGSGIK